MKKRNTSQKNSRRVKAKEARQKTFLAAYTQTGNAAAAARELGIPRSTVSDWVKLDPTFPARLDEALQVYIEKLEEEADRRAVEGVIEPVYQNGKRVGGKRKYSDTLLIFRLKALAPDRYRDNQTIEMNAKHQHSGAMELRAVAAELRNDPEYLEYLRQRAIDADAGIICGIGQSGPLENGETLSLPGSGDNGDDPGDRAEDVDN